MSSEQEAVSDTEREEAPEMRTHYSFKGGQRGRYALFANKPTEFAKFHAIDSTFRKLIAGIEIKTVSVAPLLLLRTHASFLGATRLMMSGQLAEAYMVMRACIETSLYAHHLHPSDEKIWIERDTDEATLKDFRKVFGNVSAMVQELATIDGTISKAAKLTYDHTIGMGSHPNPAMVFSNYFREDSQMGVNYLLPEGDYFDAYGLACRRTGITSLLIFRHIYGIEFDVAARVTGVLNMSL